MGVLHLFHNGWHFGLVTKVTLHWNFDGNFNTFEPFLKSPILSVILTNFTCSLFITFYVFFSSLFHCLVDIFSYICFIGTKPFKPFDIYISLMLWQLIIHELKDVYIINIWLCKFMEFSSEFSISSDIPFNIVNSQILQLSLCCISAVIIITFPHCFHPPTTRMTCNRQSHKPLCKGAFHFV